MRKFISITEAAFNRLTTDFNCTKVEHLDSINEVRYYHEAYGSTLLEVWHCATDYRCWYIQQKGAGRLGEYYV